MTVSKFSETSVRGNKGMKPDHSPCLASGPADARAVGRVDASHGILPLGSSVQIKGLWRRELLNRIVRA